MRRDVIDDISGDIMDWLKGPVTMDMSLSAPWQWASGGLAGLSGDVLLLNEPGGDFINCYQCGVFGQVNFEITWDVSSPSVYLSAHV